MAYSLQYDISHFVFYHYLNQLLEKENLTQYNLLSDTKYTSYNLERSPKPLCVFYFNFRYLTAKARHQLFHSFFFSQLFCL